MNPYAWPGHTSLLSQDSKHAAKENSDIDYQEPQAHRAAYRGVPTAILQPLDNLLDNNSWLPTSNPHTHQNEVAIARITANKPASDDGEQKLELHKRLVQLGDVSCQAQRRLQSLDNSKAALLEACAAAHHVVDDLLKRQSRVLAEPLDTDRRALLALLRRAELLAKEYAACAQTSKSSSQDLCTALLQKLAAQHDHLVSEMSHHLQQQREPANQHTATVQQLLAALVNKLQELHGQPTFNTCTSTIPAGVTQHHFVSLNKGSGATGDVTQCDQVTSMMNMIQPDAQQRQAAVVNSEQQFATSAAQTGTRTVVHDVHNPRPVANTVMALKDVPDFSDAAQWIREALGLPNTIGDQQTLPVTNNDTGAIQPLEGLPYQSLINLSDGNAATNTQHHAQLRTAYRQTLQQVRARYETQRAALQEQLQTQLAQQAEAHAVELAASRAAGEAAEARCEALSSMIQQLQSQVTQLQEQLATSRAETTILTAEVQQAQSELERQKKCLDSYQEPMNNQGYDSPPRYPDWLQPGSVRFDRSPSKQHQHSPSSSPTAVRHARSPTSKSQLSDRPLWDARVSPTASPQRQVARSFTSPSFAHQVSQHRSSLNSEQLEQSKSVRAARSPPLSPAKAFAAFHKAISIARRSQVPELSPGVVAAKQAVAAAAKAAATSAASVTTSPSRHIHTKLQQLIPASKPGRSAAPKNLPESHAPITTEQHIGADDETVNAQSKHVRDASEGVTASGQRHVHPASGNLEATPDVHIQPSPVSSDICRLVDVLLHGQQQQGNNSNLQWNAQQQQAASDAGGKALHPLTGTQPGLMKQSLHKAGDPTLIPGVWQPSSQTQPYGRLPVDTRATHQTHRIFAHRPSSPHRNSHADNMHLPGQAVCLRCGMSNAQATQQTQCQFHPALLPDPGNLRYTPEWFACKAAGHTAESAGCYVRQQHFFDNLLTEAVTNAANAGNARKSGVLKGTDSQVRLSTVLRDAKKAMPTSTQRPLRSGPSLRKTTNSPLRVKPATTDEPKPRQVVSAALPR